MLALLELTIGSTRRVKCEQRRLGVNGRRIRSARPQGTTSGARTASNERRQSAESITRIMIHCH